MFFHGGYTQVTDFLQILKVMEERMVLNFGLKLEFNLGDFLLKSYYVSNDGGGDDKPNIFIRNGFKSNC